MAGIRAHAKLVTGKTYQFIHTRKGTFEGTVVDLDPEWVTIAVTKGQARMLANPDVQPGESVVVRLRLLRWLPPPPRLAQG